MMQMQLCCEVITILHNVDDHSHVGHNIPEDLNICNVYLYNKLHLKQQKRKIGQLVFNPKYPVPNFSFLQLTLKTTVQSVMVFKYKLCHPRTHP